MDVRVEVRQSDVASGILMPKQAHTSIVREVLNREEIEIDCDALVTSSTGLTLGVHTRDCAPICFGNGTKVAVAHVGWRGLCGGIIENVLAHFGETPHEVFVGPFLHSFEVQKDACYEAIVTKFGNRFLSEENGMCTFHYKDAVASLLPVHAVFDHRNTATDASLPSHRHKRALGHIITTVQL